VAGALHVRQRVIALIGRIGGVAVAHLRGVVGVPPVGLTVAPIREDEPGVLEITARDRGRRRLEVDPERSPRRGQPRRLHDGPGAPARQMKSMVGSTRVNVVPVRSLLSKYVAVSPFVTVRVARYVAV